MLFKKVTIELENGNKVEINAPDNSDTSRYIKEMKWNGKTYSKNWISHSELMNGATLDFDMSTTPDLKRGTEKEDAPYSLTNE